MTEPADEVAVDESIEPESAAAETEVDEQTDELTKLQAELDSYKDIALRLQADFDNYRKRVSNQMTDEVQRATGRIAEALLPVLDACEAAFLRHPAEIEPIFNSLLGELRKLGLEAMNLHEKPFDPTLAEAVVHEAAVDGTVEGGEPIVSEVLRSGYTWNGRVLRPAMVKVKG